MPSPEIAPKTQPRRSWLFPCLSLLGVAVLSYLLGAAGPFFDLPSADFLHRAFLGARAWYEQRQTLPPDSDQDLPRSRIGKIDIPDKTFDGFTLYTAAGWTSTTNSHAFLINMRGDVVHTWAIPFSKVWPAPAHLQHRVYDSKVSFFSCHLYPNGDLLVVFHGLEPPIRGYGLVKLDKDSNVLWRYSAQIHHDVDVGEDGTIYAIQHELIHDIPKEFDFLPTPCLVDSLVILSPEGKDLRKPISVLEAFRNSPYSQLIAPSPERPPPGADMTREDVLHTNSVMVLTRELAPKFSPLFKAGQVLISVRDMHTIAVLDPERGSVVWAARGPWRLQHDAQFLGNGHLLLFDNFGSRKGSRVLEYDPQTQAFPWSYAGENGSSFSSPTRGMAQRLPNGNTLLVDSLGQTIFEVTNNKEVVWSCSCDAFINLGRRYSPDQLHFLKGDQRARP
jgi:Arylsulfotransferase (ASST)